MEPTKQDKETGRKFEGGRKITSNLWKIEGAVLEMSQKWKIHYI